jgi:phosphate transport system ATP-binding protein
MHTEKIIFENVNFYYGKKLSLKSLNLTFPKNKVTAIIGPSGSGKSTLIRLINRIYNLYPNQKATGKIWIDGHNILADKCDLTQLRNKVGMVFQKPSPFPMSIFQNIAFAIGIHEQLKKEELKDRVEWALKCAALWTEVKDKLNESALSLSGGQQQRLCIARSIAIKPKILLLDEPCSALDPISTQKVEQTILNLKSQFTLVLVTHNLDQAKRVSDQIVSMDQGELVESMDTELFFNMDSRFCEN